MKNRSSRSLATVLIAAGAMAAWGCGRSSPAAPSESVALSGSTRVVGSVTTSTPQVGTIKICKTGNANGTFALSATPVNGGTISAPSPVSVTAGQCIVVAEDFDAVSGVGSNVTVTETSAGLQSVSALLIGSDGAAVTIPFANGGVLFLNNFHGYTLTFVNNVAPPPPPPPPPVTVEGCSPGYFKNHTSTPSGFNRSQTLDAVLTTNVFPASLTVGSALSLKGGGVNALARHAAAAVLNAAALPTTYSFTLAQLRGIFDQIEAGTLTVEGASNLLQSKEDEGGILCPLN